MQYTLKKSLGQHFLKDEEVCRKIIAALAADPFTHLVEVGPGGGALTKYLLRVPAITFLAVEVDAEKVTYLESTYPAIKGRLLHKDFLEMAAPFGVPFTVVGNFPYNISSQILFKILEWKEQVPLVIGMFQKEVAQRVASAPGSKAYGILSILVQAFYEVEYLFDVPPSSFQPPPEVMSGVIRLRRKDREPEWTSREDFTRLVKTAFNQRRKMLRNNSKSLFDAETLKEDIFNRRPEQLSIDEFAALTFKMNN